MPLYQNILLATDFSPSSEQVIQQTHELASACKARVTLLHVIEYYQHTFNVEAYLPNLDLQQELTNQAREKLLNSAVSLNLPDIDSVVEVGIPKHEIVRVANERGCDLIILGSHGHHGLSLLIGSTADGVLHHADCDVLAVRTQK